MSRRLVEALVEGHEQMYARSPSFRFAVDQLAGMIPAMMTGLSLAALQSDRERDVIRTMIAGLPSISPETIRRAFPELDGDPPTTTEGSVP